MGIRFYCPNGHRLNVKSFLAGKRGICPHCGVGVDIPLDSQIPPGSKKFRDQHAVETAKASGEAALPEKPGGPLLALDEIEDEITTTGDSRILGGSAIRANASGASGAMPRPAPPTYGDSGIDIGGAKTGPGPAQTSNAAAANDFELPANFDAGAATAAPADAPQTPDAKPDPLAEDPTAVWYVRPPSGGQFGPAVGEVVRSWLDEGRITADSLVWREGWPEWLPADGVFPQLAKAPPVSPPGKSASAASVETSSSPAAKKSSSRAQSGKSNHVGIIVVIVLGLLSLLLLGVLIWMITQSNDDEAALGAYQTFWRCTPYLCNLAVLSVSHC